MIVWFIAALALAAILLYTLAPIAKARRQKPAWLASAFIALSATAIYGWLGNPDLSPQPAAPRIAARAVALGEIEAGVAKLRASLAAAPDKGGYVLLATSLTALGDDTGAAEAYRQAASLSAGEERETLEGQANASRIASLYKAGQAAWAKGDRAAMEAAWRPLLDELPDSAPIRAGILEKLDAPR